MNSSEDKMTAIQNAHTCAPGYLSYEEAIDTVGKSLFEDWSGVELGWQTREPFKTYNERMSAEDCDGEELGWQTHEPFRDNIFNECMRLAEAQHRLIFLVRWDVVKAAVLDTKRDQLYPLDNSAFDQHCRDAFLPTTHDMSERVPRSLQTIFDKSIRIGVSGKLLIEEKGLIQATRKNLLVLVAPREEVHSPVPERAETKPLGTRKINSYLRVICHLADELGLDLSEPYKVGASIAAAIDEELSAETIGQILIAARSVSGPNRAVAKIRKTKNG
jgi:hypothetical protein